MKIKPFPATLIIVGNVDIVFFVFARILFCILVLFLMARMELKPNLFI